MRRNSKRKFSKRKEYDQEWKREKKDPKGN
jgi:hypothetical protein